MTRKIKRSKYDKVIAGVCGGIGEFFEIDPTIIRLVFVFATFFGGIGPLLYFILLFILPENSDYKPSNFFDEDTDDYSDYKMGDFDSDKDFTHVMGDDMKFGSSNAKKSSTFLGISFILLGGMLLLKQFIPRINFIEILPVLLVLLGLIIVFKNGRK
ncbi:PspC domain-containing protein [Acetivibrio clariflavus]|uniref:Putative stress-responsive transcriptional regulator n=1 Tax=Acetivibrio clariflavus (strain DSM 19732 / NBRC 101661 / EBR45) TaxID=720554 RepID=G8LY37_ACECE|nr:PspC domain-containing protein [Acetivibrio clariflavus]AEV67768.1 putative stress-responsive transcriptional regulator [Acetivibrio clariflavus DSM 19732]